MGYSGSAGFGDKGVGRNTWRSPAVESVPFSPTTRVSLESLSEESWLIFDSILESLTCENETFAELQDSTSTGLRESDVAFRGSPDIFLVLE
jgi:hypothetical protein